MLSFLVLEKIIDEQCLQSGLRVRITPVLLSSHTSVSSTRKEVTLQTPVLPVHRPSASSSCTSSAGSLSTVCHSRRVFSSLEPSEAERHGPIESMLSSFDAVSSCGTANSDRCQHTALEHRRHERSTISRPSSKFRSIRGRGAARDRHSTIARGGESRLSLVDS